MLLMARLFRWLRSLLRKRAPSPQSHDVPRFNAEYYGGDIASENLRYTGKLPQKIMGVDVLMSPRIPVGKAIFLQRGASGFIADEFGLNATPLYRDEPRKTWRSDVSRMSAVGIDQPKSVVVVTGLT